jgi:hypothetical protein
MLDVCERVGVIADDEARIDVFDSPERREAAISWHGLTMSQKRPQSRRRNRLRMACLGRASSDETSTWPRCAKPGAISFDRRTHFVAIRQRSWDIAYLFTG